MAATALCFTLLTTVSLLFLQIHSAHSQKPDVVDFPQVVPNRQQHFEYESITVSCEGLEGLTGWRVLRKVNDTTKPCAPSLSVSTGACNIPTAFQKTDSGVYWCEMGGMKRSNTVNISITAGSVVLESPVLPVMEGHDVTLSCRQKPASSNLTAQFFKDGVLLESSSNSTGSITLDGVTKDDEGVYCCQMPGTGESLESWLHVRGVRGEPPLEEKDETTRMIPTHHTHRSAHEEDQTPFHILLPVVIGVGSIVLVLMLVVMLLLCRKKKAVIRETPASPSPVQSSVSLPRQERVPDNVQSMYAVVDRHRSDPHGSRYSATHREGTNQLLAEVDSCYDVIRY